MKYQVVYVGVEELGDQKLTEPLDFGTAHQIACELAGENGACDYVVCLASTEPTLGWWRVEGIRHHCFVWGCSAAEAIEKAIAAQRVSAWEEPQAAFMGCAPEIL
jgi:hypothetical protein